MARMNRGGEIAVDGQHTPLATRYSLPATRSPVVGRRRLEFYSWYLMRVSGLLLVGLAMGHFLIMHAVNSILDVDYQFVARRWAIPAWRIYDWFLLALSLLHGFNGLRVVVNEHLRPGVLRQSAQIVVGAATVFFLVLGTYVLVAFRAPGA